MFSFSKKDNEFFDLFLESTRYFHQGTMLLDAAMQDYSTIDDRLKEINGIEHLADKVTDRIMDKLNLTFITPIEREDIYDLAYCLDDNVDFLQEILQQISMYHISKPLAGEAGLVKLLIAASEELIIAFSLLHNIPKNREKIIEATYKVERYEGEGDRLYIQEVGLLFTNETNPIELIKWKDILEKLETTLDHCKVLAGMLRGVVLKYA